MAVQHTSSLLQQTVAGISNFADSKGKASIQEEHRDSWPGFGGDSALELAMPVPLTPSTSFEIRQSGVDAIVHTPSRAVGASPLRRKLSPIRTQQAKQLRPKLLSPKRSVLDRHRARAPSMQSSSHSISSAILDSQPSSAGGQAALANSSDSFSATSVSFAENTVLDLPSQWVTPFRERQRLRKHSARFYSPARQIVLPEEPPSRGSIAMSLSSSDHQRNFPLPYIPSSSIDADSDTRPANKASRVKALSPPRHDVRRGSSTSEYVSAQEEVSTPQMRASAGQEVPTIQRLAVSTVQSSPNKSRLTPAQQSTNDEMAGDHLGEWLVMAQPAAEVGSERPSSGTMILPLCPSRSEQQLCLAEELGEDEHFSRGIQFVLK